jgi:hypothetical protein
MEVATFFEPCSRRIDVELDIRNQNDLPLFFS